MLHFLLIHLHRITLVASFISLHNRLCMPLPRKMSLFVVLAFLFQFGVLSFHETAFHAESEHSEDHHAAGEAAFDQVHGCLVCKVLQFLPTSGSLSSPQTVSAPLLSETKVFIISKYFIPSFHHLALGSRAPPAFSFA